jgi:heme A synthase
MFPLWLILGTVTMLMGVFNKQVLRYLGFKPMSEVITTQNLKHSSRMIEQLGRWLVITLGASFLILGLGAALPAGISGKISFALLGLAGLMIVAIIGITIVNWKAR